MTRWSYRSGARQRTSLAICSTWVVRSRPPESSTTTDISVSIRVRYAFRRSGTCAFTLAAAASSVDNPDESTAAGAGVRCADADPDPSASATTAATHTDEMRFNRVPRGGCSSPCDHHLAIFRPLEWRRHIGRSQHFGRPVRKKISKPRPGTASPGAEPPVHIIPHVDENNDRRPHLSSRTHSGLREKPATHHRSFNSEICRSGWRYSRQSGW